MDIQERIYNKVWSKMEYARITKNQWENHPGGLLEQEQIDAVIEFQQQQIDEWSYILTLIEKAR